MNCPHGPGDPRTCVACLRTRAWLAHGARVLTLEQLELELRQGRHRRLVGKTGGLAVAIRAARWTARRISLACDWALSKLGGLP